SSFATAATMRPGASPVCCAMTPGPESCVTPTPAMKWPNAAPGRIPSTCRCLKHERPGFTFRARGIASCTVSRSADCNQRGTSKRTLAMSKLGLVPGELRLADLRRIVHEPDIALELDPSCHTAVDAAAATVSRVVAEGQIIYGINTGFGLLAHTRIPTEE